MGAAMRLLAGFGPRSSGGGGNQAVLPHLRWAQGGSGALILRWGRLQAGPGCGQQGEGGSGLGCTVPWETGPASWPAVHACTRLGAAVLQWKPPDLGASPRKGLFLAGEVRCVWVTLQGSQPHAQASLPTPCGGSATLPSCPQPPGGRGSSLSCVRRWGPPRDGAGGRAGASLSPGFFSWCRAHAHALL